MSKCVICEKEFSGLKCSNEWCNQEYIKCQLCKEIIPSYEIYEYRGFNSCEKCFDDLKNKVDDKRERVIETTDKAIRSQLDGEWINGGYKYMNVDKSGRPAGKVQEPQILKDYEDGIL